MWLNAASGWFRTGRNPGLAGNHLQYLRNLCRHCDWAGCLVEDLCQASQVGAESEQHRHGRGDGILLARLPLDFERRAGTTKSAYLEDVSDDGRYVLAGSVDSGSSLLYVVDTTTGYATQILLTLQGEKAEASFSPDGSQIVFAYSNDHWQSSAIMLADVHGRNVRTVLAQDANDSWPRFSPDGKTIYFIRTSGASNQRGLDLFSMSVEGKKVTQLTHQHFSFGGEPYVKAAPDVSSDGKQLFLTTQEALRIIPLPPTEGQTNSLPFDLPNSPHPRIYVSAYFSSDDQAVVFMAASEGKDGYDYDAYQGDLQSRKVQNLTKNNGYATDFRPSNRGHKAVFLKWKFSYFQKLPRSFQMQLMDMRSGTVTPVNFKGLPT